MVAGRGVSRIAVGRADHQAEHGASFAVGRYLACTRTAVAASSADRLAHLVFQITPGAIRALGVGAAGSPGGPWTGGDASGRTGHGVDHAAFLTVIAHGGAPQSAWHERRARPTGGTASCRGPAAPLPCHAGRRAADPRSAGRAAGRRCHRRAQLSFLEAEDGIAASCPKQPQQERQRSVVSDPNQRVQRTTGRRWHIVPTGAACGREAAVLSAPPCQCIGYAESLRDSR